MRKPQESPATIQVIFFLEKKMKKKIICMKFLEILEEETKGVEIKIVEMDGKETNLTIPSDYYNVLFYKNKITSVPSGDFIENIHKTWFYIVKSKNN